MITPGAAASIHNEITSTVKLPTWLHDRCQNLRTCTQADLDALCMLDRRTPRRAR